MTESSMTRVFENEQFGKVRCVSIDGDPWFVGKDVAEALGYSNTRKAIADHVEVEDMMGEVAIRDSMGRDQHPILINEPGLYSLILSSKMPAAKEFKKWILGILNGKVKPVDALIPVRVFDNTKFGNVRVIEEDGKFLFCGFDVAKALGYKRERDAIADHCKGAVKRRVPTSGGVQEMSFIPEGDLYRLIIHSKLPSAEEFEKWVFDEVLPDIRRHGQYITPEKRAEFANDPVAMLQQTIEYIQSKDKRIAELEAEKSKLETGNRELSRHAYYLEHKKDLFDFINKCVRSNAGIAHGGHMGFAWRAYFDALTPIIGRDLRKLDETPYIKQLKETEMIPAIKLAGRMAIRDVESLVGSEMMAIIRKTILG